MKTLLVLELVTSSECRHSGGGANYLCMPSDPQYTLQYRGGVQRYAYVYGSEYKNSIVGTHDHNVVFLTKTRETVMMIPAKTECPTSCVCRLQSGIHSREPFKC